jgi:phospholipid/cholesterol/gamma-HCH transport system substrate-binding protein
MVREGTVGLLIVAGAAIFGGILLWLRGLNPANRSFTVTADFDKINGVQAGSQVRYRGLSVGRISQITPGPNGVQVKMELSPADLIIPSNSELTVNQVGLLGETVLDLVPRKPLPEGAIASKPLESGCDRGVILCNNSRIRGALGISTDELLRATIRFADVYSSPQFIGNINQLTKSSSDAATEIATLSREVTGLVKAAKGEIGTFSETAKSISSAANSIGTTADKVAVTVDQVNDLVVANRTTLVTTLDNLSVMSRELRSTVSRVSPLVDRVASGRVIENLETLTANAAQASANFRDISGTLNNPANIAMLQQTLDSARITFANTQKITADLDQLTGDPDLRENLRKLINGLSGLVSSSQQLEEQKQVAEALADPTSREQIRLYLEQRSASVPQPNAPRKQ